MKSPESSFRADCLCPRAAPLLLALSVVASCAWSQESWPQFRGPNGQGISTSARPPLTFSKSNALWSVDVPVGHSSPCVWGNKIFLTSFEAQKLECRAYDRATGKLVWAKPVKLDTVEDTHPFSNPAAATPAADAEHVIFYIGSYGLLAYTHEGKLAWEKKLPQQVSRGHYGSGTSPVLCNELVVLALDSDEGGSRLLAFKRANGQLSWETPRPLFAAGWSTPVLWSKAGGSEIVLLGSKKLVSYNPIDGKELWSVPGFTMETACSPAIDADRVFACSAGLGGRSSLHFEPSAWVQLLQFDANKDGKIQIDEVPDDFRLAMRPELPEGHPGRLLPFNVRDMLRGIDEDKDGAVSEKEWQKSEEEFEQSDVPVLMALRPGQSSKSEDRVAWTYGKGIPEIPSPLAYGGKLFLIRDGGLLQCMDTQTGTVLYHERIGVSGGYAASPVVAQDRIYLASQSGTISVIDARSATLKVLARNALDEKITATPALVANTIYVRTDKHLFAFSDK
jgi:outer membrane protein assembly factor BamB